MEFVIDRKKFLEALDRVACAVDDKGPMPILSHVQLQCDGARLSIRATNLAMAAEASVEVSSAKAGCVCAPHKVLVAVLRGRADAMVRVRVNVLSLAVDAEGSRRKTSGIGCMPGDDFPSINDGVPVHAYEAQPLLAALADVAHAMADDDTRPHLSAAYVIVADGLTAVTTDGHRLAVSRQAMAPGMAPTKLLLAKSFVAALRSRPITSFGVVAVKSPAQTWVVATGPGFSLRAQPLDKAFPSYDQVVPAEHTRKLVAPRRVFSDTVSAATAAIGEKTVGVVLTLRAGGVDVLSSQPDRCEFEDGFTAENTPPIEDKDKGLRIGFNARYLGDALSSLGSEDVIAEFTGDLDPCVVRDGKRPTERFDVLMPMRV